MKAASNGESPAFAALMVDGAMHSMAVEVAADVAAVEVNLQLLI